MVDLFVKIGIYYWSLVQWQFYRSAYWRSVSWSVGRQQGRTNSAELTRQEIRKNDHIWISSGHPHENGKDDFYLTSWPLKFYSSFCAFYPCKSIPGCWLLIKVHNLYFVTRYCLPEVLTVGIFALVANQLPNGSRIVKSRNQFSVEWQWWPQYPEPHLQDYPAKISPRPRLSWTDPKRWSSVNPEALLTGWRKATKTSSLFVKISTWGAISTFLFTVVQPRDGLLFIGDFYLNISLSTLRSKIKKDLL